MKNIGLPVVAIAALFMSPLYAQTPKEGYWGQKYMDVAFSAAPTFEGGYILSGLSKSGTDTTGDIIVIKLSPHGDIQWSNTYGGPKLEGGNSVIQTADSCYMVSGHTEDYGARDCDAFLMKLDKNGKKLWLKVYGGDEDDISQSALELPGGDIVIAGISASYGNSGTSDQRHAWFVRTTAAGDTLWTRCYAGNAAEYANSIAIANTGFLAAGWTTSFGNGESDGWLLMLKENGDTAWTRLFQNDGDSKFYKIVKTTDGGFIVTG